MGLIYFEGGPLNGTAYDTRSLLGTESLQLPVNQYVWTSEKKKSERTGDVAQVWRHQDLVPGAVTAQENGHAAVATAPGAGVTAAQVAAGNQTSIGSATATQVEDPNRSTAGVVAGGAEQPAQTAYANAGTTTSATLVSGDPGAITASEAGLPTGESLFARRKALKMSVGAVVERCTLAHSKIGAIEKGVGKRVKDEEIRELDATLTQLEAERGGAGAHS